jgi:hypothetical protein
VNIVLGVWHLQVVLAKGLDHSVMEVALGAEDLVTRFYKAIEDKVEGAGSQVGEQDRWWRIIQHIGVGSGNLEEQPLGQAWVGIARNAHRDLYAL